MAIRQLRIPTAELKSPCHSADCHPIVAAVFDVGGLRETARPVYEALWLVWEARYFSQLSLARVMHVRKRTEKVSLTQQQTHLVGADMAQAMANPSQTETAQQAVLTPRHRS